MEPPNEEIPPPKPNIQRQPRKCGLCGSLGHDKRNCPTAPAVNPADPPKNCPKRANNNQDVVEKQQSKRRKQKKTNADNWEYDLSNAIYVVFDLETTGFLRQRDYIIEISAEIILPTGSYNPVPLLTPW